MKDDYRKLMLTTGDERYIYMKSKMDTGNDRWLLEANNVNRK